MKQDIRKKIDDLSPQSTVPVVKFIDKVIIDNTTKWNIDLDKLITLLIGSKDLSQAAYDSCPFPDEHGISLIISSINNMTYQAIKLINYEKVEK